MATVTDAQMLEQVVKAMPNMTDTSSKQVLADWLKNPGQMFQNNDNTNFLNTLATFVLDRIRVEDFYNPLESENIINRYSQGYGNIQRMYVKDIPAVDADFQKAWTNGESSDMFKKRTIQPTQKFAYSNISYSNRVSVPGAGFYTSVFHNYDGLVEWQAAITTAMMNTYSRWRFALFMDVIGRQTVKADLQDSQTIQTTFADIENPTAEEAMKFAKAVRKFIKATKYSSGLFNEDGFKYSQDADNIKILCKIGFKDNLIGALMNTYNPDWTREVIDRLVEVPYLGVPTYYQDEAYTTQLYPVYDANGTITSLNTNEDGTGVTVSLESAYVKVDTDNIVAIAIDNRRINYVTAVSADGRPTELTTDWTIYNIEGDYRNFYTRVIGNPSEGSGARLFADPTYNFAMFVNGNE